MRGFSQESMLLWLLILGGTSAPADEIAINGQTFTVPAGFEVVTIAGPPLVDRPISASFDDAGHLYVTESSGSNDPVEVQVEERPHRIVRLEDTDGDGVFDESVLFADRLMLPEGALWHAGSLYVAAPPEIWKFTDEDGDGQADLREVWFDGKTLTRCANDLHGPFPGPDGWLYWCKGASARQSYERPGRAPLVTRASHIFRRHPDGGPVEAVMTGGMANPVDVVFTPGGERIFTATFVTRPQAGFRDGLIHAVYGGVYGQDRPHLYDHPRTGSVMPVLDHVGAAAPCGLERLQSDQLGVSYRDNLMTCLFNMQKVIRHVLRREGGTFVSETSDFLVSNSRDFHPTDVLEDADGSLIVIDTGGWYKLCCPTSQLWKPDVLGAIYRVRRAGSHDIDDPRGLSIDWPSQSADALCRLLADPRQAVRQRAAARLPDLGDGAVEPLHTVLRSASEELYRREAVWTLTRIATPAARQAVREALDDTDRVVRQAALHSISLHRDKEAVPRLLTLLNSDSLHNRRAAAEALGRTADGEAIHVLLEATRGVEDRELEHSLLYAALEIGDAAALRRALDDPDPAIQRGALLALDQMEHSTLEIAPVLGRLRAENQRLREAAWWIVEQHANWAGAVADEFRERLRTGQTQDLAPRLARFGTEPQVQTLLSESLSDPGLPTEAHDVVLAAMAQAPLDEVPRTWRPVLLEELRAGPPDRVPAVLKVLRLQQEAPLGEEMVEQLRTIAGDQRFPADTRMLAMTLIPASGRQFDDPTVALLCDHLATSEPVQLRGLAVEVLEKTKLTHAQLLMLAGVLPDAGPMELRRVIDIFADAGDPDVGRVLVASLSECPSVTSLQPDDLEQQLAAFGDRVQPQAAAVITSIRRENAELLGKMNEVLELTANGDIRNGQAIFHGTKAACSACHAAGYLGGNIGPGLMRIGQIRTERDLLEAILFPSASFVQSYEPVTILTSDGQVYNGIIKEEIDDRLVLQLDARKAVTIPLADIEERREGTVSIMPAGLDKQFTAQELADLVAFLKSAN